MGSHHGSLILAGSISCDCVCLFAQVMMKFVVCVAVLVAVVSASYPPHPPPFYGPVHRGGYGGVGGHGGGIGPLTYLLLQKKGGLGGKGGGIHSLLPLLLAGGLGGGKKGGIDPLIFLLGGGHGKCVEHYPDGCTQPATANNDEKRLCGISTERKCGPTECYECWPCCTCPDTPSAHEWNT